MANEIKHSRRATEKSRSFNTICPCHAMYICPTCARMLGIGFGASCISYPWSGAAEQHAVEDDALSFADGRVAEHLDELWRVMPRRRVATARNLVMHLVHPLNNDSNCTRTTRVAE